jgi:hypothetical protein
VDYSGIKKFAGVIDAQLEVEKKAARGRRCPDASCYEQLL